MLRNTTTLQAVLINVLLMALWHFSMFIACITASKSLFRPNRPLYQQRSWERNGRWYSDKLHIKKWKDHLPIHTGKGGFDKSHMDGKTIEYVDEFIFETCRGEWDHWMNCLFVIVALIINPLFLGLIVAAVTLLCNLPFIAIQRYNRFRLQTLRKHILREMERAGAAHEQVMA